MDNHDPERIANIEKSGSIGASPPKYSSSAGRSFDHDEHLDFGTNFDQNLGVWNSSYAPVSAGSNVVHTAVPTSVSAPASQSGQRPKPTSSGSGSGSGKVSQFPPTINASETTEKTPIGGTEEPAKKITEETNKETEKETNKETTKTTEEETDPGNKKKSNMGELLRYAPVATNFAQYLSTLNRRPETVNARTVSPKLSGERMDYTPMDSMHMVNQMQAQGAATNRMLQSNSLGNASLANQLLMTQNLQNQQGVANAMMQMDQMNQDRRNQATDFNNRVAMENSRLDLAAQQYNQQSRDRADEVNAANRAALENQRSALLSGIGTQLGQIGTENYWGDVAKNLGLYYNRKGDYENPDKPVQKEEKVKAKGGKITSRLRSKR